VSTSKTRLVKAAPIRRAELIDCAARLMLARGYGRTTVTDLIEATGLSKGAFYHHFRSKEDLLEPIAARFALRFLTGVLALQGEVPKDALQHLNAFLAMKHEWEMEQLREHPRFFMRIRPQGDVLYHGIERAVVSVLWPALTAILEQGRREGRFDAPDPHTAAEAIVGLGEGRRLVMTQAMAIAESRSIDEATRVFAGRIRAEELTIERILDLPSGSVRIAGEGDQVVREVIATCLEQGYA